MIADAARFQLLYDNFVAWLEGHGIALNSIWSEHFNMGWMVRMMQGVTGPTEQHGDLLADLFVYVMLGLLEVDDFARRLGSLTDRETAGASLLPRARLLQRSGGTCSFVLR